MNSFGIAAYVFSVSQVPLAFLTAPTMYSSRAPSTSPFENASSNGIQRIGVANICGNAEAGNRSSNSFTRARSSPDKPASMNSRRYAASALHSPRSMVVMRRSAETLTHSPTGVTR